MTLVIHGRRGGRRDGGYDMGGLGMWDAADQKGKRRGSEGRLRLEMLGRASDIAAAWWVVAESGSRKRGRRVKGGT